MKNDSKVASESGCTNEELDVFGDFSEAQLEGQNPDIDKYLARAPGSADRLRPVLETVVRVHAEIKQLRAEFPNVDLARLLDPGWRPKGG